MKRQYKGAGSVESLAVTGVDGWRFVIAGVGAPQHAPGVVGVPGFLDAGDLAATVHGADSASMPYRIATQSGAIPTRTVARHGPDRDGRRRVGGADRPGPDGILLAPGAGLDAWRHAVETVAADGPALAAHGRRRVERLAAQFDDRAGALLAS